MSRFTCRLISNLKVVTERWLYWPTPLLDERAGQGLNEGEPGRDVRLRIQTRQILYATHFHGIFTSNDITRTQPRCEIGVVIRMCAVCRHKRLRQTNRHTARWPSARTVGIRMGGVRRHGRTLALVFEKINWGTKDHHASRRILTPLPRKQPQNNYFIRA